MTAPMIPPPAAPPALLPPPVMPWTPFQPMPTDTELAIASMRRRKLAKLLDSAKFEGMPKEWQQVAIAEYERMRQVEQAQLAPPPTPGAPAGPTPAPSQPAKPEPATPAGA